MPKTTLCLTETAVAETGDINVGLSNVWAETYTDIQGKTRQAVRGTISVMPPGGVGGFDLRLAAGDQITIGGVIYRITRFSEGEFHGSATLESVI